MACLPATSSRRSTRRAPRAATSASRSMRPRPISPPASRTGPASNSKRCRRHVPRCAAVPSPTWPIRWTR
jgi:hypothetical protein